MDPDIAILAIDHILASAQDDPDIALEALHLLAQESEEETGSSE